MASSGWQGSQYIYTVYSEIWGNLRIDGITHSGTDLRVWGVLRIEGKGSGCSYFNNGIHGYTESQSDALIVGGGVNVCSGNTFDRGFDVTIHNVSTSATSYNFDTYFYACNANNCSTKYFDVRLRWTLYFDSSAVAPSGLTTSLVDFGPDWADISVHLGSWGSPSGSASRYIEAAILGTSTYGNPYKFDTRTAIMNATIRADNSGRGSLVVTPNTQYWYGGFATNNSADTRVVSGQFTTLPAVPVINAIDQGHGVIDVTVTHATEGSALTVTEEYSIDGGTTWTTITGGAFTVTLSAQTVLTVRRSSPAGASSDTVTVTPSFTTAIYGSVLNKSVLIDKVYASAPSRAVVGATLTLDSFFTAFDEQMFVEKFQQHYLSRDYVAKGYDISSIDTRKVTIGSVTIYYLEINFAGLSMNSFTLSNASSPSGLSSAAATWGITIPSASNWGYSTTITGTYGDHPTDVSARKIKKVYGSFGGKTKLVFEDPS